MNLYEVAVKGSFGHQFPAYVLAHDAESAYIQVKNWLDSKNYGVASERGLHSVKLIAQSNEYTDYSRLFGVYKLPKEAK